MHCGPRTATNSMCAESRCKQSLCNGSWTHSKHSRPKFVVSHSPVTNLKILWCSQHCLASCAKTTFHYVQAAIVLLKNNGFKMINELGCCVKQKTECNRLQTNCLPTVVLTQSSPVCTIVFHKVVNVAQSFLSQLI